MNQKHRKKKRPSEYLASASDPASNVAAGDRCVCCGRPISSDPPLTVIVRTRSFPVCSEACRTETETYVQADRKNKIYLYLIFFICAIGILAGSLAHNQSLFLYPAISLAGVGLTLFPYPITSFETFFSCPIRRVTAVCRAVGVLLAVLGIFFLVAL
jgi:hypothetical protein